VGNELTPSAKYDFKFKDYAPWVFRELREDVFHIDPADYLVSLTEKYILSELDSPGKSGSFFYFSRDYRFIIKTIHHSEHMFLLRILKNYHHHVKSNPHTLISRFYGLHRVKLPRGRKIHFVIMNNLFPPHRDIHETYDLKGSTVGRLYPEERVAQNPRAVMKDLNWINRGKLLELGPEKRALLTEQLRRDSEWLKSINVMDYSLLVGIHNMQRGNRDNVRRNTLKVFSVRGHRCGCRCGFIYVPSSTHLASKQPDMPRVRRSPTQIKGAKSPEAIAMRRAIDSGQTASTTLALPDEDLGTLDRQHFLFYQDEGGLRATGEENGNLDTIYYLGVIDILTPYTVAKRMEHVWKGMRADRVSGVYCERLFVDDETLLCPTAQDQSCGAKRVRQSVLLVHGSDHERRRRRRALQGRVSPVDLFLLFSFSCDLLHPHALTSHTHMSICSHPVIPGRLAPFLPRTCFRSPLSSQV
jgi:1-phosphatidylinositol-4-phosphate 5-kinase